MNVERVQDDSGIWKKKGLVSQEIVQLTDQIQTFETAVTFEITLEKPFKPLRSYLRRYFEGKLRLNIKPKDDQFQSWYIRVDPKPPMKINRKPGIKKKPEPSQNIPAQASAQN